LPTLNDVMKRISHIFISLCCSIIFIWAAGYFFLSSLTSYEFEHNLHKYIHTSNTIHKNRSEGWATTRVGKYNINAVPDITKIREPKIAVWGDSYVEAWQVNDDQKMPQVITSLLHQKEIDLFCFGIGSSGDSVADYYFDMPAYEQLAQPVVAHCIIITNFTDISPDQTSDQKNGVFRSNPLRLEYIASRPSFQNIKRILNEWGLYFVWEPIRALMKTQIHLIPSIRQSSYQQSASEDPATGADIEGAWAFLLSKFKQQTEVPIIFVYCPAIPMIHNNELVLKNPDSNTARLFNQICAAYDIGFIDVSTRFLDYYKQTGKFPRGFSNTRPGSGHFNAAGHRIVAEAITAYIEMTRGS